MGILTGVYWLSPWSSSWSSRWSPPGRDAGRHDAVSALGLGLIEGFVCLVDQGVGARMGCAGNAHAGNPDAAGDVERSAAGRKRETGQGFADALGLGVGICRVATRQYDQEFFAAISADGVVAAPGGLHSPSGFAQHGVAVQMAVCVVDVLEAVEIDH